VAAARTSTLTDAVFGKLEEVAAGAQVTMIEIRCESIACLQRICCCADKWCLLGLKSETTPDVSYVKLLVDYITAQALIRYLLLCSVGARHGLNIFVV